MTHALTACADRSEWLRGTGTKVGGCRLRDMSQEPAGGLREQGWVQASHLSTWKNRVVGPEMRKQLRTAPWLGRETRQDISGCRRVSRYLPGN